MEYSTFLMAIRTFTSKNINVTSLALNSKKVVVTNISDITGDMNHIEIDMEYGDFFQSFLKWNNGELIQNAFPNLSPIEREFIVSGITEDEWSLAFLGS